MYTAQLTKERIKALCKNKKTSMEDVLVECSLGVNAIRQISDTKGMSSVSLAKIADVLDVSVDYLLGRTDEPQAICNSSTSINQKFVGGNATANIDTDKKKSSDSIIDEFFEIFSKLPIDKKLEVMTLAIEKSKE